MSSLVATQARIAANRTTDPRTPAHVSVASSRSKPGAKALDKAVAAIHAHCAVYTRPEVAAAMLDRIDWTSASDLRARRLLEPACGDGSFLLIAVERLLDSLKRHNSLSESVLGDAILAFEFERDTAEALRRRLCQLLKGAGIAPPVASRLVARWLRCEDFLLAEVAAGFTDVVGNPPYMRWSKLPLRLRKSYEDHLPAFAARGDLCLAFVCRSVQLLRASEARLAFLCADRWLRCAYGSAARAELEQVVRLSCHVEVHDVPVFRGDRKVGAYAAISILDRQLRGEALVGRASSLDDLRRRLLPGTNGTSESATPLLRGSDGALLVGNELATAFAQIASVSLALPAAGIEVRCGMALGCASVFLIEGDTDIEESRLAPWVRTRDLLADGRVQTEVRVINVWGEDGALVDLKKFPRMKAHLQRHRAELQERSCVTKVNDWYRSIDRLDIRRMSAPKILIAGMAKYSRVALSPGGAQPSNAIYAVTSREWPLGALFALFRLGALDVFASVLAPKFAGGAKRFDGNVLRQVMVPRWSSVDPGIKKILLEADVGSATPSPELIADIYKVESPRLRAALANAMARPADDTRPVAKP